MYCLVPLFGLRRALFTGIVKFYGMWQVCQNVNNCGGRRALNSNPTSSTFNYVWSNPLVNTAHPNNEATTTAMTTATTTTIATTTLLYMVCCVLWALDHLI